MRPGGLAGPPRTSRCASIDRVVFERLNDIGRRSRGLWKNARGRKIVRRAPRDPPAWRAGLPDQIGEVGATDFSVVNAALQSYGVDVPGVPVTVTSLDVDVTIEPEKLTAPGPSV